MDRRFVLAADYGAWRAGVRRVHRRDIVVRVLDLDHRYIGTLPPITDGQRTIDVGGTPTREVSLTVLDPGRTIGWEPDGADDFTYMKRMIQVWDRRLIDGVGWVGCPIFTGPIAIGGVTRTGSEVGIVAEGKERLAMGNIARSHTWGRKAVAVAVIRELLILAGEHPSRIHLPPLRDTLPEALNITRGGAYFGGPFTDAPLSTNRTQTYWQVAQRLARSMGYFLYYDGLGHARMRKAPTLPVETLDAGVLMTPPRKGREGLGTMRNRWIVLGPKPKGQKTRVSAEISLPARHDLSAQSLGRNGRPRWLIEQTVESQLRSVKKARQMVLAKRDEQMRVTEDLQVETLPIPNFEEWDLVRVIDPETGERPHLRLKQETLPLVSGNQTLGAARRVSLAQGTKGLKSTSEHFKFYRGGKK